MTTVIPPHHHNLRGRPFSIEKFLFGIFMLVNLVPVLSFKIFPTLDGATHVYNANLLANMISGNEFLNDYFKFNYEPVPNWTGHFLLIVFNWFLPAWLAEKLVMIGLLACLPLAFRSLVLSIAPQNKFFSYLIFPFSYSFVFYMGFYNFYIGIILMLYTLAYWSSHSGVTWSRRNLIILFLLVTAVYFSHIFIFGILGFLLGFHIIYFGIANRRTTGHMMKQAFVLLIISIPTLLLAAFYFMSRPAPDEIKYLSMAELNEWLTFVRPVDSFNFIDESFFSGKLNWLFFVMLTCSIIYVLRMRLRFVAPKTSLFIYLNFWFWAMLIVLLLYYTFPDSMKYTSFVSVRLGLLFFIFLIVWLSSLKYPRLISYFIPIVVLIISTGLYASRSERTSEFAQMARECYEAGEFVESNTVVLPLNYDDWMTAHFANYIGAEKPVVVLENYEAGTDYFPLSWNMDSVPNTIIGNTNIYQVPCAYWVCDTLHTTKKIDYIFVTGNQLNSHDSCVMELRKNILQNYSLIHATDFCELFELKK